MPPIAIPIICGMEWYQAGVGRGWGRGWGWVGDPTMTFPSFGTDFQAETKIKLMLPTEIPMICGNEWYHALAAG